MGLVYNITNDHSAAKSQLTDHRQIVVQTLHFSPQTDDKEAKFTVVMRYKTGGLVLNTRLQDWV